MDGAWIPQSLATRPWMDSAVEVGGKWYLTPKAARNPLSSFTNGDRNLVEVNADGSFSTHPLPYALFDNTEPGWKSAVAVGTKIFIPAFSSNSVVRMWVFDTVTEVATEVTLSGTGLSQPGYMKGCLAPDGLLYFPPYGGSSTNRPLVVNPSTNAMSLTNFSGTWPTGGEDTGSFCMGGDGNMWFAPGGITGNASGYLGGFKMGYVSFPSKTVTLVPLPDNPGTTTDISAHIWTVPAPDGVYVLSETSGRAFYKVTTAGWELLAVTNPFDPLWSNGSELSDQASFHANALIGSDGLIRTVGSRRQEPGSSYYVPVLATLNPANDEVHFEEFPSFTGHPFIGICSYMFDGKIRTFPASVGTIGGPMAAIVDIFECGPISAPSGFSWYVGDKPVTLYVGDRPVNGMFGPG